MENDKLYYGWMIFWGMYFIASNLFPEDHFKIRPVYKREITKYKIIRRLITNCIATLVTIPLISYIPRIIYTPETWYGTLIKFALLPLISEVWFYYMHRLMHIKCFYKFHADHHVFIRSYALAGLYCSVFEMIMVNQLSVAIPIQILGLSLIEITILNIIVALNVLKGHACLDYRGDIPHWLPKFVSSGRDHDVHHESMTYNYGIIYLLDRLHGTYK